jgi:hypothetical protein
MSCDVYPDIFFFGLLCCVGSGSKVAENLDRAANVIQWRNKDIFSLAGCFNKFN